LAELWRCRSLSLVNRSSNACLPAAESSEALAILATYDNRPWEQPYDHPNLHGKHYGIFFDQKTCDSAHGGFLGALKLETRTSTFPTSFVFSFFLSKVL
jgi:hypothetical protein